jgi:hypothetical protein
MLTKIKIRKYNQIIYLVKIVIFKKTKIKIHNNLRNVTFNRCQVKSFS